MLSMCPVRVHRKSERAMLRGRELAEVFEWVWGGGTDLMAGTSHVAAGSVPPRREASDLSSCVACAAMAHSRHGLGHRPFGPGQILPGLKRLCLRRCGRRKPEHGG